MDEKFTKNAVSRFRKRERNKREEMKREKKNNNIERK